MSITSWLRGRLSFAITPHRLSRKPKGHRRFDFDLLEDRVVPAVIADVSGPVVGTFGQSLTFQLTATDDAPVGVEGFTYRIDWNSDGIVDETVPQTAGNGAGVPVERIFDIPGPNTFTVTATDGDGTVSEPVSHTVTIVNGAAVVDGTLYVAGTFGNDRILFRPGGRQSASDANLKVWINRQYFGVFTGVNDITVYALDGHDFVHLAGSIKVNATVFGGAGNDRIIGGAGHDVLIGGEGLDRLLGHTGHDILIGGSGRDLLNGGPGDDLLIASSTIYDDDAAALKALQDAWTAPGKYADRIAALTDPTANVYLTIDGPEATVLDDGDPDRLAGASGRDWFFAFVPNDRVTGRHHTEFLNLSEGAKPHGP